MNESRIEELTDKSVEIAFAKLNRYCINCKDPVTSKSVAILASAILNVVTSQKMQ